MLSSRSDVLLPLHTKHRRSPSALRNVVTLAMATAVFLGTRSLMFATPSSEAVRSNTVFESDLDAHGSFRGAEWVSSSFCLLMRLVLQGAIASSVVYWWSSAPFEKHFLKTGRHFGLLPSMLLLSTLLFLLMHTGTPLSFLLPQSNPVPPDSSRTFYSEALGAHGMSGSDLSSWSAGSALLFIFARGALLLAFCGMIFISCNLLQCSKVFCSSCSALTERLAIVRAICMGGREWQKMSKMPIPSAMKFFAA